MTFDKQIIEAINSIRPLGYCVTGMSNNEKLYSTIKKLHPTAITEGLLRIGPDKDGGYLVPDAFNGIKYCFSPGVADNTGFEDDLFRKYGISSFLADASVNITQQDKAYLSFVKKFLSYERSEGNITLEKWISESLPNDAYSDLILQMDIEGGEYDVLVNCAPATLQRFRIIVIEFHLLNALEEFAFHFVFDKIVNKITRDHSVVHIHPNNVGSVLKVGEQEIPSHLEFTFLRNDFLNEGGELKFPHRFDCKNVSGPDLVLPRCWWAK